MKAPPPPPPSPPPQQPNRTVRASEEERWPLLDLPPDHEISLGMEPIFWDEGRSRPTLAGSTPAVGGTSVAVGHSSTVTPKPKPPPPAVSSPGGNGTTYSGGDTNAPATVLAVGQALQAPVPAWDREFAPPGALQPLVLLREGGISQVPLFVPPRRYSVGTSRGTHSHLSSSGGASELPHSTDSIEPPPPPPPQFSRASTMNSGRLGGPVSPRGPGYRAAGPCAGVSTATSRPPVPPVPSGQPPRNGGGPRLVGPGQRSEESMEL